MASRSASAWSSRRRTTAPIAPPSTSSKRASTSRSSPTCARTRTGRCSEAARAAGLEVAHGAEILGVDGRLRVKSVRIKHQGGERKVACDALIMSGGWTPSVHLFSQSRGKLVFDEALQVFRPGTSAQRERSAGACNATFDLAGALAEGDAAGRAAAAAAGFVAPDARVYAVDGAAGTLEPVSSPLVGEDQGGGSRRPPGLAGGPPDNLDGPRDPPPLPAPARGGGGGRTPPPTAAARRSSISRTTCAPRT